MSPRPSATGHWTASCGNGESCRVRRGPALRADDAPRSMIACRCVIGSKRPSTHPTRQAMTEAEWLAYDDPQKLLGSLPAAVSDRKQRLFACTCCRRIRHLLSQPEFFRAVE